MEKIYRVALASFGMSGRVFHGPLLKVHPGFRVKKVLERSKSLSAGFFRDADIVRDYSDITNDPEIDLVIVNTPDYLHYEMAKQALEAGKHVVVEKPFTVHTGEADTLISLAEKKRKILTVFQNRRWDGDFLTVQKIIREGWLGRLVEYESHFDRYRNYIREESWKDREGVSTGSIYNLGSHLIDQSLVLFGMPEAVFGDMRAVRSEGRVNDYFDVRLYYPVFRVILKSSYLVMQPGPRFMLHGEEGSYLKYGLDPQEEHLISGMLPVTSDWGAEDKKYWGELVSDGELTYHGKYETVPGNYPAFYENLYLTLQGAEDIAVSPRESRDVIYLIELAIRSDRERRVVEV